MQRPNPATNQTGFCSSISQSSLYTKNLLKTSVRREKTEQESHLEGIHVHWVGEGVAVKFRHCTVKFILWRKRQNDSSLLPGDVCSSWVLMVLLWHWASAHASLDRWTASPEAVPSHFESIILPLFLEIMSIGLKCAVLVTQSVHCGKRTKWAPFQRRRKYSDSLLE